MPVIKNNQVYPDWCEVAEHRKIKITQKMPYKVKMENTKKAVVVLRGNCEVDFGNETKKLSERETVLVAAPQRFYRDSHDTRT